MNIEALIEKSEKELIEEGVDDSIKTLCEEFCNFPKESISQIICGDKEIIEFEW